MSKEYYFPENGVSENYTNPAQVSPIKEVLPVTEDPYTEEYDGPTGDESVVKETLTTDTEELVTPDVTEEEFLASQSKEATPEVVEEPIQDPITDPVVTPTPTKKGKKN